MRAGLHAAGKRACSRPRGPVGLEDILYGPYILMAVSVHHFPYHGAYAGEREPAFEEHRHGYLVGCVQSRRGRAAGSKRLVSQGKAREPFGLRVMELERK